jgi:hypothetical protein
MNGQPFTVIADRLASPPTQQAEQFLRRPLVIVAGGCDPVHKAHIDRYSNTLKLAFKRFRGTVVSGGTNAGVSGIVGEIAAESRDAGGNSRIVAIGYLPPRELVEAEGDQLDARYQELFFVVPAEGVDPLYSPLGPIQTWSDIVAAGVAPGKVRVVGINGGQLSGFEFRLAVAMGATAGLIEDSGRAVSTFLTDPDWRKQKGVARLINDAETIEMFVNAFIDSTNPNDKPLDDSVIESLGQRFHQNYRQSKSSSQEYVDPSMLPWEKLDTILRESNLLQVRGMTWILSTEGFAVVPAEHAGAAIDLRDGKYGERVDRMARLEHARWNAERFALGFSYGLTRSMKEKINEYLVPWGQLTPELQAYDRDPFKNLAGELNWLGEQEHGAKLKIIDLRAE